jgi:anti-anti-sigma regulatory factor
MPGRVQGLDRRWFALRLPPALTLHTRRDVQEAVRLVLADGFRTVILDAAALHVVDTVGLGALVGLAREAAQYGARLVVAGLAGQPLDCWEMCQLDRVPGLVGTAPDVATARAAACGERAA